MRKFFLKLFFGKDVADNMANVINASKTYNTYAVENDGFNDKYLFDFKSKFLGSWNTATTGIIIGGDGSIDSTAKENKPTQKIVIKPIDVLNELEVIPTPFSLELLDEKISVLKDKEKLINQSYAKREITALIERLENRKKYPEVREFFDSFQNTNEEKIDKLLGKYALVMKESDIFIPEFPDDAIAIMKAYTEKVEAICGKKPVYYVIAEEKDFRKAYEKRDPILLAQSPFGFYYQILGAWDKEMLLLGEL